VAPAIGQETDAEQPDKVVAAVTGHRYRTPVKYAG